MRAGTHQVKCGNHWQWFGFWFFLQFWLGLLRGHVPDLLDLPGKVVDDLLHVLELKSKLGPVLTRIGKFLNEISVFLRGSLYLLIPAFDGKIGFLVDFFYLCVDVTDMAFDLIDSPGVVVVALVLGHKLEILVVNGVHLLLVVLAVAALRLCYVLDLLANAAKLDPSVLCEVLLGLQLILQPFFLPLDASLSLSDQFLILQQFLELQLYLVNLLL